MLQPTTLSFANQPDITNIVPKIGGKVSMLANVRETLCKRYQLAKAARVEAQRRLLLIDRIKTLRQFIQSEVDFRPQIGMIDQ